MIFSKEFIWYKDHFVYHITETKNLESISQKGLIPLCGERSKLAHDTRKAIYFFDALNTRFDIEDWIQELYEEKNKLELELLRFNLKRRKWYSQDAEVGDFYLLNKIPANKIDLLIRKDGNNQEYSIDTIKRQKNLIWQPLVK